MSYIKRYFEEHIDEFTDEELISWGWSLEEIKFLRECFSKAKGDDRMRNYIYPDCDGCKYEDCNDMKILMKSCIVCKRGYNDEPEKTTYPDLYENKED